MRFAVLASLVLVALKLFGVVSFDWPWVAVPMGLIFLVRFVSYAWEFISD